MKVNIRHTRPEDYVEVSELGTETYPDNYYEGTESFISKMKGCPEGCFVADLEGIIGYVISFPYMVGKSFPIDSFFTQSDDPNCWYIHDLCVAKDFRNKGVAKNLVNIILKLDYFNIFCLTAVEGSENFWNRMGFRSFFEVEYCGQKAQYMVLIK